MLLGALGASLLGNMLAGKGFIRAGEGTAKVGYVSKRSSSKRSSLKDLRFKKFFDSTLKCKCIVKINGVYSTDNLLDKIRYEAYVMIFHEYSDIETHWIVLYVNA